MNKYLIAIIIIILAVAWALGNETPYETRLANAIYRAEGGAHTVWPYGIKQRFQHTTPRQACINTIRHQMRNWEADGRPAIFVDYLADRYCPKSADPIGHAKWIKNVSYFMQD